MTPASPERPVVVDLKAEHLRLGPTLERVRKRLLDLSASNPLLNYRHPKASSLRIVDEVPAHVFERLVDGGRFTFASLPDPERRDGVATARSTEPCEGADAATAPATTANDRAEDPRARAARERKAAQARRDARRLRRAGELGIATSYDLPQLATGVAAHHRDSKLQTLLFPDELEEQLRKIHRTAIGSLEETGANRLHLLCGFVEWSEAGYGDGERVTRLAPLVLVPVTLGRRDVDPETNTYRYTLERSGEDWSTNVTLQEKCRAEFNLVLPDADPEGENLEQYFARVERLLRGAQPTWTLKRQLTLGLVSFGKILMWRDLDPANWPRGKSPFASAPLRTLLGAHDATDADGAAARAGAAVEYPLDQLDDTPDAVPPVIIEADSSQHSALVDVERGVDLVLQGPPGTGKSQTITNLIAAAIRRGRRVLFVAEKKAALDVVHTRLRGAGLGDFCLALHSHTSAKREFIQELAHRLALRTDPPRVPRELPGLTVRLHAARDALGRPLDALHAPFGTVALSPYEIFWRSRRLSATLPRDVLDAIADLRLSQAVHAGRQDVAARRDLVDDFAGAFGKVREEGTALARHPWAGVTHDDLAHAAVEDLLDAAHVWRGALDALRREADAVERTINGSVDRSPAALLVLASTLHDLPPLGSSAPADLPQRLLASVTVPEVRAAVDAVSAARAQWAAIDGPWRDHANARRPVLDAVRAALDGVVGRFAHETTVAEVGDVGVAARAAAHALSAAEQLGDRVRAALGGAAGARPLTAADTVALIAIVRHTRRVDPAALALRTAATADPHTVLVLERLAARAAALRAERAALDARFAPSFRPPIATLREMAGPLATAPRFLPGLFSGAYRDAVREYRTMAGGRDDNRAAMLSAVRELVAHVDAATALAAEPVLGEVFGARVVGIDSAFDAAAVAAIWQARVGESTTPLGEAGRDLARAVRGATAEQWRGALEHVAAAPDAWTAADALDATLQSATAIAGVAASAWDGKPLADVRDTLDVLAARCAALVEAAGAAGVAAAGTIGDVHVRHTRALAAWNAEDVVSRHTDVLRRLGVDVLGAETEVAPVEAALQYIGHVQSARLPAAVAHWLVGPDARARLLALQQLADKVGGAAQTARHAATPFVERARLDPLVWAGAPLETVSVDDLWGRVDDALAHDRALHPWAVYLHSRALALGAGLGELVALVEQERVGRDRAGDAYEAAFYRTLAHAALRERRVLDTFDSGVQNEVRQRFARLDAEQEVLVREEIAATLARSTPVPGCSGPRVGDMTEEHLIEHQAGLQRRHVAVRELFRRSGRAIQAMKPCFLMGPQAVAQYLPPGEFEFDLVVMDEASQMRPEDALGAIARARQVLIVGDPMQLGPSRFFDKQDGGDGDGSTDGTTDATDQDEADAVAEGDDLPPPPNPLPVDGATVLERSESVLLAAAAQFPVRMLRWHYRSRHPRLIAFSNREFYHDRLIVFPTPDANAPSAVATDGDSSHDGVFMHRVDGMYAGRRNVREAEAVVDAVRRHARARPERSLMIATLNAEQADLIDGLIETVEKEDLALGDFRARHAKSQEPFAVKNLENVQGDERDTIFVSVTFGPDDAGRLRQHFGPINQAGGERRLNVLFTRAKHRLDVFCSFAPGDLRVSPTTSPRGLRVLRDYLRYASGDDLWWAAGTETGRPPDSDFEVAVATGLRTRGYDVRAQVGVAGYFLDLAVIDPDEPGRFLLGVECDGATYHSAKTARDRDRLRQRQLESLGWTLYRIWSTDWFRDSAHQIDRLAAQIETMRARRGAAIQPFDVTPAAPSTAPAP